MTVAQNSVIAGYNSGSFEFPVPAVPVPLLPFITLSYTIATSIIHTEYFFY